MFRTLCCRHKCFPRLPTRATFVADTKNVSDFVRHFVSATNVFQFAQPQKHHGQQCVRNNVSSFTRAFRVLGSKVLIVVYTSLYVKAIRLYEFISFKLLVFSRHPSRRVYCAGKPIERAVYRINENRWELALYQA